MTWQQINFRRLIIWLLPIELRRVKTVAWLYALLYPLEQLYESIMYRMQHDSRVIYLEKMLNEWYGVPTYNHQDHEATKTIYIEDGFKPKKTYIYQPYEHKPVYIFTPSENEPVYIYMLAEFLLNYVKFVVWIPLSYTYNEAVLKAKINYYKLAGKSYKIERYVL